MFSALAGRRTSIGGIVGFRAGWGLGNALFIATSLAVIVASATGGFAGAIVLYEAALGLGIAAGPLVGGLLGNISWRGPFFGVAVLMAIALRRDRRPARTRRPSPARRPRCVGPAQGAAPPRPADDEPHRAALQLGLLHDARVRAVPDGPVERRSSASSSSAGVLLVAFFAVIGAPRLQAPVRHGTARSTARWRCSPSLLAAHRDCSPTSAGALIACVVVSGTVVGINNTLTTQAVMLVAPVERPVASASYGFVRFIGGGLAPFAAGKLAEHYDLHVPFLVGAVAVVIGIGVLTTGHRMLSRADADMAAGGHAPSDDDVAGEVADEFGGAPGRSTTSSRPRHTPAPDALR